MVGGRAGACWCTDWAWVGGGLSKHQVDHPLGHPMGRWSRLASCHRNKNLAGHLWHPQIIPPQQMSNQNWSCTTWKKKIRICQNYFLSVFTRSAEGTAETGVFVPSCCCFSKFWICFWKAQRFLFYLSLIFVFWQQPCWLCVFLGPELLITGCS